MSGTAATRPRRRYSYPTAPRRVYWEITRACPLACTACTLNALPERHPRELTTSEARSLLREIRSFGDPPPELIITGGDPLCRPDLDELLTYARQELGLAPILWLGPTGRLTPTRLAQVQAAGARAVGLAVDDITPEGHDRHHAPGAFARTMEAIEAARAIRLDVHVNTMVTETSLVDLPKVFELIRTLDIAQWNVFFLVRTGGAKMLPPLKPLQAEVLLNWLYDCSRTATFRIEVMEAPQYRRIVFQRLREARVPLAEIHKAPQADQFGLREGNGILFISHVGDVYPSPFLPIVAGNIRGRSLTALYRRSPLFRELRDPSRLRGDCGRCEFRRICGGCRARAYAETCDWTAADPLCAYQPIGIQQAI